MLLGVSTGEQPTELPELEGRVRMKSRSAGVGERGEERMKRGEEEEKKVQLLGVQLRSAHVQ